MRTALGIFWLLVVLVSLVFVAMAVADLNAPASDTEPGVAWGLLVLFGLTAAGGLWLARSSFRPPARSTARLEREQAVLAVARAHGGRVTIAEVALEARLGIAEARDALDALGAQGVAHTWISEAGDIVHVFPGFMTADDKLSARDPLAL